MIMETNLINIKPYPKPKKSGGGGSSNITFNINTSDIGGDLNVKSLNANRVVAEYIEANNLEATNGNFVYRFDGGLDQDLGLQVYKNYLYKILVTYDLSEQKLNISINGQEVLRDKVLTTTSLRSITISAKNDAGISTKKVYNIALTYEEKPTSDLRDRKVELLTSMEDGYKNAYITSGREDELYINMMKVKEPIQ